MVGLQLLLLPSIGKLGLKIAAGLAALALVVLMALTSSAGADPVPPAGPELIKQLQQDRPVSGGSMSLPAGLRPWMDLISTAADRYKVEPELVSAVLLAESGGDPEAVSPVGAMGLMQLMPDTAQALGVSDAFDPTQNIHGGAHYLAVLLKEAKDWPIGDLQPLWAAVAAYNTGPNAVKHYRGIPPYGETQRYVMVVLNYYLNLKKVMKKGVPATETTSVASAGGGVR